MPSSAPFSGEHPYTRYSLILFFLLLLLGMSFLLARWTAPVHGLEVTFINLSSHQIESLQLDFGSAATQSSILALRIAPGEKRKLLLNHAPGLGFNVKAVYSNGQTQEFCALRGDTKARPKLYLHH